MHDRNGVPISVGDEIVLKGKVVETTIRNGNFCSVQVVVEGYWDGKGGTTKMWFAAKQLFVVAKAPTATQDGE